MERIITIQEARPKLGELVDGISSAELDPVVITKRGKSFAVLVSREDFTLLKHLQASESHQSLQTKLDKLQGLVQEKGFDMALVKDLLEE